MRGMQFFTESGSSGVAGKAFGGHRKADLVERNASVVLRAVLRQIRDSSTIPVPGRKSVVFVRGMQEISSRGRVVWGRRCGLWRAPEGRSRREECIRGPESRVGADPRFTLSSRGNCNVGAGAGVVT